MSAATRSAPEAAASTSLGRQGGRRRRRRRRRDQTLSQLERRLVYAIASGTAIAAVFSDARPTGMAIADGLWTAAFAFVVVLLASKAKRWALVWLAAGGMALAIGDPFVVAGAAALALCAVSITLRHRDRVLGAGVAALAVLAVLNAPDLAFFGLPSLGAVVAVGPVCYSGFKYASKRVRRNVAWALVGAAALTVVAAIGLVLAGRSASDHVGSGVAHLDRGLRALRAGDHGGAQRSFSAASASFSSATDALHTPWALPAYAVPVLGPQAEAMATMASAGTELTARGAALAGSASPRDLTLSGGSVPVEQLLALRSPVRGVVDGLADARSQLERVDTGWVAFPIADKLHELAGAIEHAQPDLDTLSTATQIVPGLLGADGPRRYLVVAATPAESRFEGGTIAAYAEVSADNGKLSVGRTGTIGELNSATPPEKRRFSGSRLFDERYGRFTPAQRMENLTASPDLPANAAAIADIYRQAGGSHLDGVVYVDPAGLASLLKLTGPVSVPGSSAPVSADTVGPMLNSAAVTDEQVRSVLAATLDAVRTQPLPDAGRIIDALAPPVRQGHLALSALDDGSQKLLDRVGLSGRFIPTDAGDYVDVRVANVSGQPTDATLRPRLDYRVTFDPATGHVESTLTVALHVDGSAAGASATGTRVYLSTFTPLTLVRGDGGGAPLSFEQQEEFGGRVYSTILDVPASGDAVVDLRLEGTLPRHPRYDLIVGHQPLAGDGELAVTVRSAPGGPPVAEAPGFHIEGDTATWKGPLDESKRFTVHFGG